MPDENDPNLPDNAGDAADAMAGLLGDQNTPAEGEATLTTMAGMTGAEALAAEQAEHAKENEAKVAATKERQVDEREKRVKENQDAALERAIANNMDDAGQAEDTGDLQRKYTMPTPVDNKPRERAKNWSPDVSITISCEVNGETKSCDLLMRNAAGQLNPSQYNAVSVVGLMAATLKQFSTSVEVAPMKQEADAA